MTTITTNKTAGISLTSATYTNPIVINSDVSVSNAAHTGNAVYATTGYWAIQNDGSITSARTFGDGISLGSGGAVTNAASASIIGAVDGVAITGTAGTVINYGSIAATHEGGTGVYLGSGGSVTNATSASITGYEFGRPFGTGVAIRKGIGTLVNDGTIGGEQGVALYSGGAVTNAASASIAGSSSGVLIQGGAGTVINGGSIGGETSFLEGFVGTGISLTSGGSVTNAASASIAGYNGLIVAGGVGTVVNYGGILGAGNYDDFGRYGIGIALKAGGSVTNAVSASIEGYNALEVIGGKGTVVNDGTIYGTGERRYGDGAVGIYLNSGGSVTNAASAKIGGYLGVEGYGGPVAVINAGHIYGFAIAGVDLRDGGSVTNESGALIRGYNVGITGADTIVNYGSITGTGGEGTSGAGVAGGLVTNAASASISGLDEGIVTESRDLLLVGTVVNDGSISSPAGFGVDLTVGGTVTNGPSASITSALSGVVTDSGAGTVINQGSIGATGKYEPGVYLFSGGLVTNAAAASISGAYDGIGVAVKGGAGTVVNYGSIASTGTTGYGVELRSGGSVTNASSASIMGDTDGVKLDTGGTLTNAGTVIGNAGTAVYLGGTASNLLVLAPDYGFSGIAMGGASATNTLELASATSPGTLSGLGTEFVDFGQTTVDDNASWTFNGANTIEAGATLTELSGATLTVAGTLVNDGSIIIDPSTLTAGGLTGTGLVTIDAGSTLQVQGAVGGGETLMFAGNDAYLYLGTPGDIAGSVTNAEVGDVIDLRGVNPASVSYSGGVLSFTGGSFALSLASPGTVAASPSSDGALVSVLCFCVNTLILTPSGECSVQELAVGGMVTTHRGATRQIVWIGTGKMLATQGRRDAATPVIVRQGALADNVPNRDLRVTKGHSFYIDDVLIPVEFLVNHRSILWDDNAQEVELYHIELETHDVLVANGAPAESYRDDGNRWLFRNANSGWGLPPQTPCAPVLTGGPVVDTAWRRLLERAGPRPGIPTTDDADLHLLVDGQRVDADSRGDAWHVFRLSGLPANVRIASRTGVPQEMGLARDPRCLGVALRQIIVTRGAQIRTIEAEDAVLTDGFHEYEADNDIRWTDGDAAMPAGLFEGFNGPLEIALRLGGRTSYLDEGTLPQAA